MMYCCPWDADQMGSKSCATAAAVPKWTSCSKRRISPMIPVAAGRFFCDLVVVEWSQCLNHPQPNHLTSLDLEFQRLTGHPCQVRKGCSLQVVHPQRFCPEVSCLLSKLEAQRVKESTQSQGRTLEHFGTVELIYCNWFWPWHFAWWKVSSLRRTSDVFGVPTASEPRRGVVASKPTTMRSRHRILKQASRAKTHDGNDRLCYVNPCDVFFY